MPAASWRAARQRIALQLPGAGHGALAYRAAGRVRRGGGAGGLRLRRLQRRGGAGADRLRVRHRADHLGGAGRARHDLGPVLGAILINLAASYLSGYMPFVWQLLLGVTFIVVILLLPRGCCRCCWGRNGARPPPTAPALTAAGAGRRGGVEPARRGQALRQPAGAGRHRPEGRRRRAAGTDRPERRGQDHADALHRRRRRALGRRDRAVRPDHTARGPAFCVRAGLGRKFQNANIFDSMTVAESLRIASAIRERPSWLRRAPELRLPPYALEVLRMTELDQCLTAQRATCRTASSRRWNWPWCWRWSRAWCCWTSPRRA